MLLMTVQCTTIRASIMTLDSYPLEDDVMEKVRSTHPKDNNDASNSALEKNHQRDKDFVKGNLFILLMTGQPLEHPI